MASRLFARIASQVVFALAALVALPAFGQGLRVPERPEPGIDPTFARGWLSPQHERFGFTTFNWRDAVGFAPSPRSHWSYALDERSSLGMSYRSGHVYEPNERQMSLYGRYWLTHDWALGVESTSREPGGLFRLNDFRIGVQRRF